MVPVDSLQVGSLLPVADMEPADSLLVGRSLLPVVDMADSLLVGQVEILLVARNLPVADMVDNPLVVRVEILPVADMLPLRNPEVDNLPVENLLVVRKRLVVAPAESFLVAEIPSAVVAVAPLAEQVADLPLEQCRPDLQAAEVDLFEC